MESWEIQIVKTLATVDTAQKPCRAQVFCAGICTGIRTLVRSLLPFTAKDTSWVKGKRTGFALKQHQV